MKFHLDVDMGFLKEKQYPLKSGKHAFYVKVNSLCTTFRNQYNFERFDNSQNQKILENSEKIPFISHFGHGWKNERDIYKHALLRLPFKKCLSFEKHLQTYAEAVKFPYSLDWVLDEFDSSFNELAAASLRYHMDYAVTYCSPERREKYEKLIERLLPPPIELPKDYVQHDHESFQDFMDCDVCEIQSEKINALQDERKKKVEAARRDFLDVVPELWS